MAPKRRAKGSGTTTTIAAAAAAAAASPRRTRSATAAGKRAAAEETKGSKGKSKAFVDKEPLAPPPISSGDGDASKTIIVEACKQCNSFKTRAIKVKDGLESAVPGVTVTINPEKPRRGCFEIREDGGEVFVSLLDMPRPFKLMKNLDMDEVIVDIVKKIS
ncbi:selenoprotein H [Ananas comosus]|uniref:Selenoprotein H n=1 Tax=Ananas comosus TaxID=4615 RepID=A0A6P5H9P7_ANACO|nr:selenoprotein H [Ananas comosus]